MEFDWNDLAFSSKKPINTLKATFIAAPRDLSPTRFTQLVKELLPKGNIVLGIAKEPYVLGLENQPQFRMLQAKTVEAIVRKVAASASPHKIYLLSYFQRDLPHLLDKLRFKRVVLINGSWYRAFHLRPEFYALVKQGTPYELVSPFASEQEALAYISATTLQPVPQTGNFTEREMLALAGQAATHSYAYSEFQTGVTLGRKTGDGYKLIATAHNTIVPFETFAMHYGAARETNFSPMNDLNHYDALHAEMQLLTQCLATRTDLTKTTLFINLLPCPACARMLAQTTIAEFVYREDHSDGYAVTMLQSAGKKVRRAVA